MTNLNFIFLNVALLIFNPNATVLNKKQITSDFNFETRINTIHLKVVDLTDIFVLHNVKEFNEVYFKSLNFEGSVIQFIQKKGSLENKVIAICMMTKLPTKNYIELLNAYFELYNKNKIGEELLDRCFFNEFDTSNQLIKQYKNPQVIKLLNKMILSKALSKQFKHDLKEVLSGKAYNGLKKSRLL